MAHPIRRLALSRRAFLRGAGATIALPWLDAMTPALARPAPTPVRTLFVFAPNGVRVDEWLPPARNGPVELTPTLTPLQVVSRHVTLFRGLAIDAGRSHGDGTGDHARAASTFLTCAHPVKTGGADIRVGVSVDQVVARAVGGETAFPSLELGMEGGRSAGVCDSGYSCAYSNNISWRTESTPVAKETEPRAVFARLFGDPEEHVSRAEEARRRHRLRNVLDTALGDLKRLQRDLSAEDRQKLDEYADAVRDVESRIARMEAEEEEVRQQVPSEILEAYRENDYADRVRLMFELIALAFETDRTRVATLMLGNGGSDRSYRFLGVPQGHHTLSHHGRNPEKLDRIGRIDRFFVERLAELLARLDGAEESGASLLDQSMVLFGSGISDGNRHNHDDLPILLAGRGGGRLRSGRNVAFERETPLANLYLTMLGVLGIRTERFADSDGTVDAILE